MPLRLDVRRPAPGTGPEVELWLDVPSHLDYVGPAVELIVGSCPVGTLSPRRVLFNLRTALAEALSNAIAYGNHHDPAKPVRVRVECAAEAARVPRRRPAVDGGGEGGGGGGRRDPPDGLAWFERGPGAEGVWLEIGEGDRGGGDGGARQALARVVGSVLATEREAAQVAAELSERYEEIDLIYTISEILGHTIRLDEAAQRIVTEVSTVVRAGRATLLVLDEERRVLRLVAARGMDAHEVEPIELDDSCSVAARVFREGRIIGYDPTDPAAENPGCGEEERRRYKGKAFL